MKQVVSQPTSGPKGKRRTHVAYVKKTEIGKVDYVWSAGANSKNLNVPGGLAWHEYYYPWTRDDSYDFQKQLAWFNANHPDWVLYQKDRTTLANGFGDAIVVLDFTNPAVQKWVLDTYWFPAIQHGFQGISIDNGTLINYTHAAGHKTAGGGWMQLYSGESTDDGYARAQAAALEEMVTAFKARYPRATISLNQPFTPDPLWKLSLQYVDMVWDESGYTDYANGYATSDAVSWSPNPWLTRTQAYVDLQKQDGRGFMFATYLPGYPDNVVTTSLSKRDMQFRAELQWELANYLMIKYNHTYFDAAFRTAKFENQPELHAPIGTPTGDFYASQNVYMRDFTQGKAVVNPSSTSSFTVTLPSGQFKDLYRNPVTTYTLPPHSGLVLLEESAKAKHSSRPASIQLPSGCPRPRTVTAL